MNMIIIQVLIKNIVKTLKNFKINVEEINDKTIQLYKIDKDLFEKISKYVIKNENFKLLLHPYLVLY